MMVGKEDGVQERTIHAVLAREGKQISLEKVKYLLRSELGRFCLHDPDEATFGGTYTWFINDAGTEYFAERDKL